MQNFENDQINLGELERLTPYDIRRLKSIVDQLLQNEDIDNARRGPLLATPKDHTHELVLLDPATEYLIEDNFASMNVTSGTIGALGWLGSMSIWNTAATAWDDDYPVGSNVLLLTSATAAIGLGDFVGANRLTPFHQARDFDATFIIAVADFNNTANIIYGIGVGFASANTGLTPTNAIWVEKQFADTQFYLASRSGGVATRTAIPTSQMEPNVPQYTAGVSYWRLRIRKTASNVVTLNVNGGADITVTATLPTARLWPIILFSENSGNQRMLWPIFFRLYYSGLSR